MISPRDFGQAGHAALHVDDHHLHRAGDDSQLLLKEVARHRNAVANEDFVGRAANTRQRHAPRSGLFGVFDDLRLLDRNGKHFGKRGFMPMHDDVHGIMAQYSQVRIAAHGRRGAEKNVGGN